MTQFLLAAEADQIQDTVFRATHLREVVGGSQLLSRFCADSPCALRDNKYPGRVKAVVNDGGSFRILIEGTEQEARQFGAYLAEIYRLTLDRTLTVAEPLPTSSDFQSDNQKASGQLRQVKRRACGGAASPQFPFMALCATCGVGLATEHRSRHDDDQPNYLCASCRSKTLERTTNSYGAFLGPFCQKVGERITQLAQEGVKFCDATREAARGVKTNPENAIKTKEVVFPLDSDDVAGYDPRNYVAYLLADVNNMGQVFDQCSNEEQLRTLSQTLPNVIRESLAYPTARMIAQPIVTWLERRTRKPESRFFPVLPLILGGDDLFALLPAPFAIDATLQFCQQFAERIEEAFQDDALHSLTQVSQLPTISACVVICKSNYPFYLAQQAGHQRLNDAKRLTKALHQQRKLEAGTSALTFELVLGSQLAPEHSSGDYRATLRPYFTQDVTAGLGKPAKDLLEQRLKLRDLKGTRRSALRGLYEPPNIPQDRREDSLKNWQRGFRELLGRIQRMSGEEHPQALSFLGEWHQVRRPLESRDWQGSELPDLLDLWDFTCEIDKFPYREPEG